MTDPYEKIEDGDASPTLMERVSAFLPDVNLDILDPSTSQSLRDRVSLIFEYCRPWDSFANVTNFNRPPMNVDEYKGRVKKNFEDFFYNYFVIALVFLGMYALFNVWKVIVLVLYVAMGYVLFIAFPEDIEVTDSFKINALYKKVIMGIGLILTIMYGGVWNLLFSIGFFMLFVVGVHASINETETET